MKRKVMTRVYGVYVLRQVTRLEVRLAALATLMVALVATVSVSDVAVNALGAMGSFEGFFGYVTDALLSTEVAVQVGILAVGALFVWALRDAWQWVTHGSFFASRGHV